MGERASRRWSVDEDACLLALVERSGPAAGDERAWQAVAEQMPTGGGRDGRQCRERWEQALADGCAEEKGARRAKDARELSQVRCGAPGPCVPLRACSARRTPL